MWQLSQNVRHDQRLLDIFRFSCAVPKVDMAENNSKSAGDTVQAVQAVRRIELKNTSISRV